MHFDFSTELILMCNTVGVRGRNFLRLVAFRSLHTTIHSLLEKLSGTCEGWTYAPWCSPQAHIAAPVSSLQSLQTLWTCICSPASCHRWLQNTNYVRLRVVTVTSMQMPSLLAIVPPDEDLLCIPLQEKNTPSAYFPKAMFRLAYLWINTFARPSLVSFDSVGQL